MSTYKVGDLASLVSSTKPQHNLKSLFDEHWNKRQKSSAVKDPKKNKAELKNSDLKTDTQSSNTKEKKKKKKTRNSLIVNSPPKNFTKDVETDFNSDFLPIHNKKKPKRKFSEDSPEKNKQDTEHSKNVKGFIRCAKNKRQKTSEKDNAGSFSIKQDHIKDTLFNEFATNKNASSKNKKLFRKNVDSANIEANDIKENTSEDNENNFKNLSKKRKDKKKLIQTPTNDTESTGSDGFKNLFNETTESEDTFECQSKKKKNKKKSKQLHQIPSNVDDEEQEMDSSVKSNKEKSRMDPEEIRALNLKDLPFTLFVGNLPVSVNKKMLFKLFSSFGQIKTVRLRGAVSTKMSIPKKVAEIKGEYHEGLHSHTGFVVFKEEESAKKALSLNGTLIGDHHIVVDFASEPGKKKLYSNDLSIFVGNLPFDIDDETVRSAFQECGEIHALRIIRDKNTGLGKGFGYVQFRNTKSKEKALSLEDIEIKGRNIRIKPVESDRGMKSGSKKAVMSIRNNMAFKRTGNKKSVKKLLKRGKQAHKKKQIARLLGEKFVK